ncbi:MAG TPA: M12 family metallo-peptidase [Rudaea sp.]|nr:M12 family metallo-peptidase [Rudaea sp.]
MIDVSALATLPATLLVNFPDRTAVTLIRWRYQERGPGAFLWTGHGGDCSAVFTVAPIALHGTISCLNANYGVEQVIDGSAFRLNRYIGNPSAPIAKPEDAPPSGLPGAVTDQTPATPNNAPDTAIDILVLYSEATRFHFDPNGGNAGTVAFARHCVDITQQAMENSTSGWQPGQPAIATVNFVGAREVAGPSSPQLITDYLQYAVADPESVSLRNLYAADAVVYLVENGLNAYGVAAVPGSTSPGGTQIAPPGPGFAPRAVAVVQRNTAVADDTGTYPQEPFVFPHEFAHLIGANHDVAAAGNNTTPLQSWAYGWYRDHAEGGARTILAYVEPSCTAPCTRILNYSNPDIYNDWFRTGTAASANNALIIADYSSYTAQYRASLGRIFYDGFDY